MMKRTGSLARALGAARRAVAVGAAALALGAAPSTAQEDWPQDPITIVVPFNAGGSADRMARSLTGPLGEELGVPVTVENRPGGSGGLGATWMAQQPADGNTLLLMQATPYLANAILVGGAPVAWEDFAFLNAQWNDYAIVAVHQDSPYETFGELVEAMRQPGEVSSGIIYGNGGHLQTILFMQALDIPEENVRFVTYDGGSPLRAALAGNQVDFEVLAAGGASGIMDSLRVLAVVNTSNPDGFDAPLLNEAMTELGADPVAVIGGNVSGLLVHAALKEDHPERYETLVSAYEAAVTSDAYKAAAAEAGVGADWIGPEESQAMADDAYGALEGLADVLN
jgi:tripartite-type tricarboxylate transporter receptor subunit TctC